jgi:hypothetical protein
MFCHTIDRTYYTNILLVLVCLYAVLAIVLCAVAVELSFLVVFMAISLSSQTAKFVFPR